MIGQHGRGITRDTNQKWMTKTDIAGTAGQDVPAHCEYRQKIRKNEDAQRTRGNNERQ